jgi:hypothetical protein
MNLIEGDRPSAAPSVGLEDPAPGGNNIIVAAHAFRLAAWPSGSGLPKAKAGLGFMPAFLYLSAPRDGDRRRGGLANAQAWADLGERRRAWLAQACGGALAPYLAGEARIEVGDAPVAQEDGGQDLVVSALRLQDIGDYRSALQAWFAPLRIGGRLVIAVPHAFLFERQLGLPSRWRPQQRRLYTPRSLLEEVEEALVPNTYRVRHLGDLDAGYDYLMDDEAPPAGSSEIVLVLEKIAAPPWTLLLTPEPDVLTERRDAPDYQFEPPRTRVEVEARPRLSRVLLLKLDHMGDFIMGLPALERARALFADAEITLVVGSWNLDMARSLGLADRVVAFDVFPRNSSEEEVDVPGKAALFQQAFPEPYDLAVDLRSDPDTRFLLRLAKAALRAGIGTRAQFPFLDIFLPVDFTRGEPEAAKEFAFRPLDFASQGSTTRTAHRIRAEAARAERDCAIVWGPYRHLRAGRYLFEPYVEVEPGSGVVLFDVALDAHRVAEAYVEGPVARRFAFTVEAERASFEFRIWTVGEEPSLSFSLFGGRLIREGAASTLHQSEYLSLLLELIAMRLQKTGVLTELAAP